MNTIKIRSADGFEAEISPNDLEIREDKKDEIPKCGEVTTGKDFNYKEYILRTFGIDCFVLKPWQNALLVGKGKQRSLKEFVEVIE